MTTSTPATTRPLGEQVHRYHLDRPLGNGPFAFSTCDDVVIEGWAFVAPPGSTLSSVTLEVVSVRTGAVTQVNCERGARPDVAEHFGDPRLLSTGFTGRFHLDPSFRGKYRVRLLQVKD